MLFIGNDCLICLPEVSKAGTISIVLWYRIPQLATGHFAAIAKHKRDYLARFPTERKPNPALIGFLTDKRPEFIKFERHRGRIGWNCRYQRLYQWW